MVAPPVFHGGAQFILFWNLPQNHSTTCNVYSVDSSLRLYAWIAIKLVVNVVANPDDDPDPTLQNVRIRVLTYLSFSVIIPGKILLLKYVLQIWFIKHKVK
jgi:hypothetical protein